MKPYHLLTALAFFSAASPLIGQNAASPRYIPFQAQVTNQTGALVDDGQYTVIFNLYNTAVGGQPIWSERHVKIGVTGGAINVFLGSISSIGSIDFSTAKYLGITVDVDGLASTAEPEMVPRSVIIPAFHAKNAEKLAGFDWSAAFTTSDPTTGFIKSTRIDSNTINTTQVVNNAVTTVKINDTAVTTDKLADGSVTNPKLAANSVATVNIQAGAITSAKLSSDVTTPPGTIVAYIGDTAPTGWMLCDGSEVNRTGAGANLAIVVGTRFGSATDPVNKFKLPDLRGYFLRGADGGTGRDPDSGASTNGGADGKRFPMATGGSATGVGSVQGEAFKSHFHYSDGTTAGGNKHPVWTGGVDGQFDAASSYATSNDATYAVGSKVGNAGGSETRPKNAYVNYIIKL